MPRYPIELTLPAPIQGINTSQPETILPELFSPELTNVIMSDGSIKKRLGFAEQGDVSAVNNYPIMEGVEYGDSSAANHLVFCTSNGLIEWDGSTTFTTRYGGTTLTGTDAFPIFMSPVGGMSTDYLYISNGKDAIKQWSGSGNWTNLTLSSGFTTLLGKSLLGYRGHLILGNVTEDGSTFPYRVRWSEVSDPTDWNDSALESAGYLNLIEDATNSKVMCMHPLREAVAVYKQGAIYTMTYTGSPNYFVPRLVMSDRGTISPKGVGILDKVHLVVSQDNIYLFDGASFDSPPIGDRIKKDFFDDLNYQYREKLYVKTIPHRFECWIIYPSGDSTTCDAAYCFNYLYNAWTKHTFGRSLYSVQVHNQTVNTPESYFGGNGEFYEAFSGNTDDGVAVSATLRTKLFNFKEQQMQNLRKTVRRVELEVEQTPSVQVGATEMIHTAATYDTAQTVANDANAVGIKRTHNTNTGRYINLKVTDTGTGTPFTVSGYTIYAEPRGGK